MTPTRVSVALSTHDGARHLPAQLDSLAAQTHLPAELVVRDDGSTDATVALLDRFAATAPFPVHVVPGDRVGLAAALAEVLARTDGDVVALCDQDDVWRPAKLARCVAVLDERPDAVAVATDGRLVDDDGRPLGGTTFAALGFTPALRAGFGDDPVRTLAFRSVLTGHALVVRRPVVHAALPFPPELLDAADAGPATGPGRGTATQPDRWISLVAAGLGPIAVIEDPLVDHRQHAAQATGIDARRRVLAARQARRMLAQVGARGTGARQRLLDRAALLDAAAARTGNRSLADAAAHLRRRAALPAHRLQRLGPIRDERGRGGYRWSGGTAVALSDAVRPLR